MGKVDDLRKMREARYEAMQRRKVDPSLLLPGLSVEVVGNADTIKAAEEAAANYDIPLVDPDLCGHKSVSGKSCTRPKDHTEKNHRYK